MYRPTSLYSQCLAVLFEVLGGEEDLQTTSIVPVDSARTFASLNVLQNGVLVIAKIAKIAKRVKGKGER